MRSKSGALYINKITIVWEAPATVGGGTLSDEEFELTSVANEYGTISFTNAAGETITKAQEGDVVTVTVTPDDEHEPNFGGLFSLTHDLELKLELVHAR